MLSLKVFLAASAVFCASDLGASAKPTPRSPSLGLTPKSALEFDSQSISARDGDKTVNVPISQIYYAPASNRGYVTYTNSYADSDIVILAMDVYGKAAGPNHTKFKFEATIPSPELYPLKPGDTSGDLSALTFYDGALNPPSESGFYYYNLTLDGTLQYLHDEASEKQDLITRVPVRYNNIDTGQQSGKCPQATKGSAAQAKPDDKKRIRIDCLYISYSQDLTNTYFEVFFTNVWNDALLMEEVSLTALGSDTGNKAFSTTLTRGDITVQAVRPGDSSQISGIINLRLKNPYNYNNLQNTTRFDLKNVKIKYLAGRTTEKLKNYASEFELNT